MTYKTSLDKGAKIITIGTTALFAAIIITQYFIINTANLLIPICTIVALLAIFFTVFAFRPINYQMSAGRLIIHRLSGDVKIDRSQIKSVEILDKEKMGRVVRIFGVGGFFGYYGKFANTKMGSMTWYATRRDKTVLVKMQNNKKIVLTPDEPEKFVASCTG
jgi:Bacterial PH domain